jgi:hypothetical protein
MLKPHLLDQLTVMQYPDMNGIETPSYQQVSFFSKHQADIRSSSCVGSLDHQEQRQQSRQRKAKVVTHILQQAMTPVINRQSLYWTTMGISEVKDKPSIDTATHNWHPHYDDHGADVIFLSSDNIRFGMSLKVLAKSR